MADPLVVKVYACSKCPFCVVEVEPADEFFPESHRWWCAETTGKDFMPQEGRPPHEYRDFACPLDKHDIIIKAANV